MINTVIIADDLTGANDTGAILAQNGFKVGTILKTDQNIGKKFLLLKMTL